MSGNGDREVGNTKRCTAIRSNGEPPDNILFTPPCDCPDCAPNQFYDRPAGTGDDGYLRVRGHRQRYRVEVVELGATGRAVLG